MAYAGASTRMAHTTRRTGAVVSRRRRTHARRCVCRPRVNVLDLCIPKTREASRGATTTIKADGVPEVKRSRAWWCRKTLAATVVTANCLQADVSPPEASLCVAPGGRASNLASQGRPSGGACVGTGCASQEARPAVRASGHSRDATPHAISNEGASAEIFVGGGNQSPGTPAVLRHAREEDEKKRHNTPGRVHIAPGSGVLWPGLERRAGDVICIWGCVCARGANTAQ